jgi:hypothetical protein
MYTQLFLLALVSAAAPAEWLVYEGGQGPGQGKHVVLVSGDEEYRSEEALPVLARILSSHHGFRCTVLFAMREGYVDPNNTHNIPGLEALETADLMIIATRFRDLPDHQMQYIDAYLRRGRPVIGLRTATHAFVIPAEKAYAHYGNDYNGPRKLWSGGFGRLVLGEKWVSHHGKHGQQATRGIINSDQKAHPIVRGCEDIFGPTDVYTVRLPLPGDSQTLVYGAVLDGMKPDSRPLEGAKNDPMMPVAWTKTYQLEGGKAGKVFTTTMGAAVDLQSEGLRRLIVNAAYWCVGLENQIPERAKVVIPGRFEPSYFGFKESNFWIEKALRPSDLK